MAEIVIDIGSHVGNLTKGLALQEKLEALQQPLRKQNEQKFWPDGAFTPTAPVLTAAGKKVLKKASTRSRRTYKEV